MEHINREEHKEVIVDLMADSQSAVTAWYQAGQETMLALASKGETDVLPKILDKEGLLGVNPEDPSGLPGWFARLWESSVFRPKLFSLVKDRDQAIMDPKTFGAFYLFHILSGGEEEVVLREVCATPEEVVEEFTEELFGFLGGIRIHPAVYKTVGKVAARYFSLPWETEEAMECVFAPGCSEETLELFLKGLMEVREFKKGEITSFLAEGAILAFFANPVADDDGSYLVEKESIRRYLAELFEIEEETAA